MNYLTDKKTTFAGAVVYENTWLNHTLSLGSTLFSKELRFHLMNHFNTDKDAFFVKKTSIHFSAGNTSAVIESISEKNSPSFIYLKAKSHH